MKECFAVLSKDKDLLMFPFLTTVVLIVLNVPFHGVYQRVVLRTAMQSDFMAIFLLYIANYFVVIFFNSGLMTFASLRLAGIDPTLADGFRAAFSHIGRILLWAIVAATVGLVLQMLERRANLITRLILSAIDIAWSLATYFIIPVMILEDVDVFEALKRSAALIKRQWGTEVVSNFSFSLLFSPLSLPAFALGLLAAFIGVDFGPVPLIALLAVFLAYLILLYEVAVALQGIFVVALYRYANNEHMPGSFSLDLMKSAFTPKDV